MEHGKRSAFFESMDRKALHLLSTLKAGIPRNDCTALWQALPEGADGSGSKRKWYDDQKKKRAEELKRMGLEPDQVAHPVPALAVALTLAPGSAVHVEVQMRSIRGEVKQTDLKLNHTFDSFEAPLRLAWCC